MLSVIIVNYRNQQKTIKYILTELIKIKIPHIVVVVNNAATCESNQEFSEAFGVELVIDINKPINKDKQCFVIAHPNNLGFAKGNNLGVEFSIKHFMIDYFLFSNNDIRIVDKDAVEQLVNKISGLSNVGIIGPKVVGLDGKSQSPEPYYSFGLRYFFRYWLTPFLPKSWSNRLMKFDYPQKAKEGFHYKVMGSFFIVRAKDFIECSMMDPNTFLYSEEVILTERMKKIGKSVYYYPEVTILHEHGVTISKNISNSKIIELQFDSESYYYKNYIGIPNIYIWLGKQSLRLYNNLKKSL